MRVVHEQLHNSSPKCSKQVICNIQTWHDGYQPIGDVGIFILVMATLVKQRLVIMGQLPVQGSVPGPTSNVWDQK